MAKRIKNEYNRIEKAKDKDHKRIEESDDIIYIEYNEEYIMKTYIKV